MPSKNPHEKLVNPYAAPQSELQLLPQESTPQRVTKPINWNLTVIAWLVFFGGFALICAIEYTMRHVLGLAGLKSPNEMAEVVWFASPGLLAAGSLYLLWLSTGGIAQNWIRLLLVVFQGVIGFVLYAYCCLIYVVYSGIDSL